MPEAKKKTVFETMSAIDVSSYLFKKNGMSYLPWSRAIELLKLNYSDAKVTECTFECTKPMSTLFTKTKDGETYDVLYDKIEMPYFTDGRTCFVKTRLEIPSQGIDEYCTLPVMDYKNQCIPADKITMNDVNKSLRRCATKGIAMATGLGLGLWHKEEVSETAEAQKIIDKLERNDVLAKFKALISKGFDKVKLAAWSKENFGTANPAQIKSDEILERMSKALDELDIKDFQPDKKTK